MNVSTTVANLRVDRSDQTLSNAYETMHHLRDSLRVLVEWQAPSISLDRKREGVLQTLRVFCGQLKQILDFEEEDGYMVVVTDRRPNWHSRVAHLRDEHVALRQRIEVLEELTDDQTQWKGERLDRGYETIEDLLDLLDQHEHEEISLLQESLLNDVGGEG